jgi:hypothetical protein
MLNDLSAFAAIAAWDKQEDSYYLQGFTEEFFNIIG